jgi:hypothetical protein
LTAFNSDRLNKIFKDAVLKHPDQYPGSEVDLTAFRIGSDDLIHDMADAIKELFKESDEEPLNEYETPGHVSIQYDGFTVNVDSTITQKEWEKRNP